MLGRGGHARGGNHLYRVATDFAPKVGSPKIIGSRWGNKTRGSNVSASLGFAVPVGPVTINGSVSVHPQDTFTGSQGPDQDAGKEFDSYHANQVNGLWEGSHLFRFQASTHYAATWRTDCGSTRSLRERRRCSPRRRAGASAGISLGSAVPRSSGGAAALVCLAVLGLALTAGGCGGPGKEAKRRARSKALAAPARFSGGALPGTLYLLAGPNPYSSDVYRVRGQLNSSKRLTTTALGLGVSWITAQGPHVAVADARDGGIDGEDFGDADLIVAGQRWRLP